MNNFDTSHRIYNLLDEDPSMITLMKPSSITEDMWYFCIQRDTSLFKEMKHPSEKMCMFALAEDGRNLKYLYSKFTDIKVTNKMIWTAITSRPSAIYYVPKKKRTTEMKEYAFSLEPELMLNEDDIRHEFLENMLSEHPENIKYIRNPDDDLVILALKANPNVVTYVSKLSEPVIIFIKERYPDIIQLIQPLLAQESVEIEDKIPS